MCVCARMHAMHVHVPLHDHVLAGMHACAHVCMLTCKTGMCRHVLGRTILEASLVEDREQAREQRGLRFKGLVKEGH